MSKELNGFLIQPSSKWKPDKEMLYRIETLGFRTIGTDNREVIFATVKYSNGSRNCIIFDTKDAYYPIKMEMK